MQVVYSTNTTLKRAVRIITKVNNEIVHVVENFFNDLYKCEDQREIKLQDLRKNITET